MKGEGVENGREVLNYMFIFLVQRLACSKKFPWDLNYVHLPLDY